MPANGAEAGDPFVGSRTLTLYGDDNVKDGFTLGQHTADFVISTEDGSHYTVTANGGALSLSMVRSGSRLSLSPRPQGTTVDSHMLCDGAVGAFVLVGRELHDPEDISIRLATWAPPATVLASDLAGDWDMTAIDTDNLLGNLVTPFEITPRTWAIHALAPDLVDVRLTEYNVTWRMRIVGNTLLPLAETGQVHLSMVTDGRALALSAIGVEEEDNTDISPGIFLGTRRGSQPVGGLDLSGQYWFGSLSVDAATNVPWAKRGTVSITGHQWDQAWEDGNGPHSFSSAFSTTVDADGSVNLNFPGQRYNVAWNGDLMIHAGSVLHGGGEGIDILMRKATNVNINDVAGDYSFFGHWLGTRDGSDETGWGRVSFYADGSANANWVSSRGYLRNDNTCSWYLDEANAVVYGSCDDYPNLVGKNGMYAPFGDITWDGHFGYDLFIRKTDQAMTMADIAGTYQIRFLETGPGPVPYTCGRGTGVIKAVDHANGILSVEAYYSDGEHDLFTMNCSVGPGNEFRLADEPDGIISPDRGLIFLPEYRYEKPPTRRDYDWLGGIFLVRTPNNVPAPASGAWVRRSRMKTARDQFAGGVIGNEIFVFGGNATDGTNLYSGEKYDMAADAWSGISDNPHYESPFGLPWGVEEVSGIGYNGKFYVFGPSYVNYNQMYDPAANTWTTLAKKPTPTGATVPVLCEGEIFFFGGYTGNSTASGAVEAYDPGRNTWRKVGDMPKSLSSHAVAVHDHCAYIIGGGGGGAINEEVMRYDFRTNAWERNYDTAPSDAARIYAYAGQTPVINGRVYLIGGSQCDPEGCWPVDTFTIFDIESKEWDSGPALPEPRQSHLTVVAGNTIYVIGGEDDAGAKDTVFAFRLPDSLSSQPVGPSGAK
ncbi:MAG: hypothetical protein MUC88_00825 [Planctomycetes bacterium]|nr:hypothetical protein [Planctomycetota bacterium]